jgi:hypothetical protein
LFPGIWSQGANDLKVLLNLSDGGVRLEPALNERDNLLANEAVLCNNRCGEQGSNGEENLFFV